MLLSSPKCRTTGLRPVRTLSEQENDRIRLGAFAASTGTAERGAGLEVAEMLGEWGDEEPRLCGRP